MYPFLQRELNSSSAGGQFSDLMQTAKPSGQFFYSVIQTAQNRNSQVKAENILHVGDNPICDGVGPAKIGIQYAIIDGPANLFEAVCNRIQRA